jgi:hypothetical protein
VVCGTSQGFCRKEIEGLALNHCTKGWRRGGAGGGDAGGTVSGCLWDDSDTSSMPIKIGRGNECDVYLV